MPIHDTGYQHWQGRHQGIWRRRAVIAANGLRGCLQSKWTRNLLVLCWGMALVQVSVLFLMGQLLVKDSLAVRWTGHFNSQLKAFVGALTGWLELHPEISVNCAQNLLFYFFTSWLLTPTMLIVALAIPHLITRDLSSQAITIYASKAVGRFDYLLGKFAALTGLMTLAWLGPVCLSWFLGNLLAPHWHFFWHSRAALTNALIYVLCGMGILGVLGLGVSAVSHREKMTVGIWLGLWFAGQALTPIARQTKPWLEHLSLGANLHHLSLSIFKLKNDIALVQENIPVFGGMLRGVRHQAFAAIQNPDFWGAASGLSAMLILAALIVYWRVKPE